MTKCHNPFPPCYKDGVYLITYQNPTGGGFVVYGSCESHINGMLRGYGDMAYVKHVRIADAE